MGIMPLLIICSILVAGGFLVAFLWATRSGQFDDVHTPSLTVLFEEDRVETEPSNTADNQLKT